MSWEISGEAGKKFGADRRASSEVASDVILRYEALQPDRVSWSVSGALSDLSDLALPELGEEVSLWRAGVRKFRGICTGVPATISGGDIAVRVTLEGAHWWLEKTPLTSPETDADGTTQNRANVVFAKGGLLGHFRRLFALAKAEGLPVDLGAVAELYEVPQTTVPEGSFAEALAELVRLVPDAMTWWDYSGGVPLFRLSRRASAETLELAYGGGLLESAQLSPRLGLETEEVVVQYAERGLDGEVRFREQRSGQPAAGKRQVIVTSGAELADIIPPDPIESETLSTTDIFTGGGGFRLAAVEELWPFWVDWQARFSAVIPTGAETLFRWLVTDSDSTRYADGRTPDYYDADGASVDTSTGARHVFLTEPDRLPEWLAEVLDYEEISLSGTFMIVFETTAVSDYPDWVKFALNAADYQDSVLSGGDITFYLYYDVEIPLAGVTDTVGALTEASFFNPLAYQYLSPPAGFAKALREAQGFLPYEGSLSLVESQAGGVDPRGQVVNVSGALGEWQSMAALVQGTELSLADGRQTIRCGAPERLSYQDIVNRLRTSSRDNVTL
jgi:hypothetical protein